MRATMTCPGLMFPGHVGLCYMPLDWTSARPCIFFAAHRGSVALLELTVEHLLQQPGIFHADDMSGPTKLG